MTRVVTENSIHKQMGKQNYETMQLRRRPAPGTVSIYEIKVFEDITAVQAGDGAFIWEIPEDLDGALLVKIEIFITTVSSSGIVRCQLHNITQAVDMLSTRVSIDQGEKNSKDAATAVVIDTSNDDVAWGDHLRIDVDDAGTGAMGLGAIVVFSPSTSSGVRGLRGADGPAGPTGPLGPTGPTGIGTTGPTGPPGGIIAWQGQWTTSTFYSIDDAVSNNGSSYVAIADHTSGASTEPGVGANWEDDWVLLVSGTTGSVTANDGNLVVAMEVFA